MYGTWGPVDRFIITMVIPVIACAGGPLLGVAVGRWLRFPGASLLAVIVVVEWSQIASYLPEQDLDSGTLFARALHMAAPYTAFGNGTGEVTVWVRTYTGSPAWFAVWTLDPLRTRGDRRTLARRRRSDPPHRRSNRRRTGRRGGRRPRHGHCHRQ